ncbi:MAG: hypothetical protein AB7O62_00120 [Pirellulales bacterium]
MSDNVPTPDQPGEVPPPTDTSVPTSAPAAIPQSMPSNVSTSAVRKYLMYTLSVPERAIRSSVGLVGGALRESTSLLVPQAFQSSKTYEVLIKQMLDFVVQDIGGVEGNAKSDTPAVENFVARKAVGNFIELAGLATLHLSPITLLAVVSDVAYGSQFYLKELSRELKEKGVIDENSTIDHVDDLLAAVSDASGKMAGTFNTPPLSVEGLKKTIQDTRDAVASIDPTAVIPQAELERLWNEMNDLAAQEKVGVFEVSSAMTLSALDKIGTVTRGALSSVVVAGKLFDRHVLEHYQEAAIRIHSQGLLATVSQSSRPYISAVWKNFDHARPTMTEDVVTGRWLKRSFLALRECWRGKPKPPPAT